MNPRKLIVVAALLTAAATVSPLAFPQGRDPAAAELLFREGRTAMKRGDYAAACPKFAESQRLDPAAGTVLNLAQCEEAQGLLASAWQHYQEAFDQSQRSDPRRALADKAARALEPRVPRLTITLAEEAPSDCKVVRDTVELRAASLGTPLPVDPGEHVITVSAPGREAKQFKVRAAEGKRVSITVGPGEPTLAAPEPPSPDEPTQTPPPPPKPADGAGSTQRTIGWVVAGVGIVGGAVGATYFGFDAKDKDGQARRLGCDDTSCPPDPEAVSADAASTKSKTYAQYSAIGGGVLLIGGIVLVLTAASDNTDQPTAFTLRTVARPGVAGLELGGMW